MTQLQNQLRRTSHEVGHLTAVRGVVLRQAQHDASSGTAANTHSGVSLSLSKAGTWRCLRRRDAGGPRKTGEQDALRAEASKSKSGVCRSAPCAVCFAAGEHLRRSRTSRVAMRLSDRGTWFVRSARPSPARYRSSPTLGIRRHLAPDVRSRLTCGEEPIGTRDEGLGISVCARITHHRLSPRLGDLVIGALGNLVPNPQSLVPLHRASAFFLLAEQKTIHVAVSHLHHVQTTSPALFGVGRLQTTSLQETEASSHGAEPVGLFLARGPIFKAKCGKSVG